MIEKFYVRRWNMSKWDCLVVIDCTCEELLLDMASGEILYAEDAEGEPIYPLE